METANKESYLNSIAALAQFPFPAYEANKTYWASKAKQINATGNFRKLVGDVKRSCGKAKYSAHTSSTLHRVVQSHALRSARG